MRLLVRRAGFLCSVQDLGRAGYRASGVPLAGALDPVALRVANLLVGNPETAAGLEAALGTVVLRFEEARAIAWCGGDFAVTLDNESLPPGQRISVPAGAELTLAAPPKGARLWLAIRGGIDVPLVLGSRATDLRAGFGGWQGRALREGDELPLGPAAIIEKQPANCFAPREWSRPSPVPGILHFVRGNGWDEFFGEAQGAFTRETFAVTADSDRMGLRLRGRKIVGSHRDDLVSEPVAPGTIQVPPNGQPVILLGDCQTIGGYPKIGHVITVDLPKAAQLRAGDEVRFVEVPLAAARKLLQERERDLAWFRAGLALRTP